MNIYDCFRGKIIQKNYLQTFPCGIPKLGIRQLVDVAVDLKTSQ